MVHHYGPTPPPRKPPTEADVDRAYWRGRDRQIALRNSALTWGTIIGLLLGSVAWPIIDFIREMF